MLKWYVASIVTLTVYSICSPKKKIPKLLFECRAINLGDEILCSNTAFYAPTYLPCQQLIWASLLQLALAFCVWAECASVKLNQLWQVLHADGSPIFPLFTGLLNIPRALL